MSARARVVPAACAALAVLSGALAGAAQTDGPSAPTDAPEVAGLGAATTDTTALDAAPTEPEATARAIAMAASAPPDTRDFVAVEGTRFTVGGEPFHFVGANVAVMHGPAHRAAMEATLDAAHADGLSVVRLWALGEYDADAPAWADAYAFRRGPSDWLDPALVHLDRTLEACRVRGLRAIVVLANRWSDYGGLGTYARWALVPFTPGEGGSVGTSELGRLYERPEVRDLYRAHVERIVGRTSSITGVPYRDEPTIVAWELANELEASRRDAAALVRWVEAEAAHVRSLDPRHLVSAGHVGYSTSSERRTWRDVAGARGIDYADAHAYPTRYGEVHTLAELARYVDDRAQLAHHVIRRPLVFGEVGFSATHPRVLGVARRRWLDAFLRAAARDGVGGVLSWIYVPGDDRPSEHAIVTSGADVARTRDLRDVLARHARRWARTPPTERNPRLGPEIGEEPLWDPRRTVHGGGGVHDGWARPDADERRVLVIDPVAFDRARFERAGVEDDAPVAHLWATGAGWVRYRFRAPRGTRAAPTLLELSLRGSSELPGPGLGARAEDVSRVVVSLDGVEVGVLELPPDDGVGRVVTLRVADPIVLAPLGERGAHTLELATSEDDLGACLYGAPGSRADELSPEARAELPGEVRLVWSAAP